MKSTTIRLALGAIGMFLTAPPAVARQDDSFEWRGRVASGGFIEIRGISGDIRAVPASGDEIEVVARKYGRDSDFDEVEIEVVESRDGVTVCAVYFGSRGRSDPCDGGSYDDRRSRRGQRGRSRDIRVSVDFEVRVPAGVSFEGVTVSGDVEAQDLASRVVARTVSGSIFVSSSELVDATTVSGSIDVAMGRADWRGDLEFSTVSGDITLSFPEGLDTEVEFASLSGDIDSDFAITIQSRRSRWIGGAVRGTIGDGGRSLSLKTVSGDVTLRRGR